MITLDWTLFLQAGIFLFLVVFLSKVLFKPVIQVMEAREQMHKGPAKEATRLREEVEHLRAEVNAAIDQAKGQADAIRGELVSRAREDESRILAENKKQIEAHLEKNRVEIQHQVAAASETLKSEAEKLGRVLAAKLVSGEGGRG